MTDLERQAMAVLKVYERWGVGRNAPCSKMLGQILAAAAAAIVDETRKEN